MQSNQNNKAMMNDEQKSMTNYTCYDDDLVHTTFTYVSKDFQFQINTR